MYIHQFKKITNDYKVFIYQSFCDKNFNVSTYGIYNFGNNKKHQHTHTKYMTRLIIQQLVDIQKKNVRLFCNILLSFIYELV